MILEKEIQKEILDYLNNKRIFHFVTDGGGLPDIIVCYEGRFIGLEVKRPKLGTAQGHQKVISDEIIKSGGYSIFPRSVEDVKKLLKKIDVDVQWER